MYQVEDYSFPNGWQNGTPEDRARQCCEQLEDNQILFFPGTPFDFPAEDIQLLLDNKNLKTSRKNIIFDPKQNTIRGVDEEPAATQMRDAMRHYHQGVTKFLSEILAPYAPHWQPLSPSYRPEEEQGRDIETLKRNDLMHTDAFKDRPTQGGRIMRCFTNINPTAARVWHTTDAFPALAEKFGKDAGLHQIAAGKEDKGGFMQKLLGKKAPDRSKYDTFMLKFHDYLKLNEDYQQKYPKQRIEFPPHSTWICFTDAVPHAVLSGQFALEQTMLIPMSAMVTPEKAPLRVLEKLTATVMA